MENTASIIAHKDICEDIYSSRHMAPGEDRYFVSPNEVFNKKSYRLNEKIGLDITTGSSTRVMIGFVKKD